MKLLFLILATSAFAANGDSEKAFQELKKAVEQNEVEAKACTPFEEARKPLADSKLEFTTPSHKTKEQALQALAALEKVKVPFPKGEAASEMVLNKLDLLARYPQQIELLKLVGKLRIDCDSLFPMIHLSLLFKDQAKFAFEKAEKERIERAAKSFLHDNAPGTAVNMLYQATRGHAMVSYLDHQYKGPRRAEYLVEAKNIMKEFEKNRQTFKDNLRDFSLKHKAPSILIKQFENKLGKKIYADSSQLAKKVFK